MMFHQEIHEHPHPRRHRRAAHEHRMNRLPITGIEGLQQRHQITALQVLCHTEFADACDAGADPGELRQRLAAAAFDVAANLQGERLAVAGKRPVGFGAAEVEAQAVVLQQVFRLLRRAMALRNIGVSMLPGATALMRMPRPAYSIAAALVMPATANFDDV